MVPGQKESVSFFIPDREGEHSPEVLYALLAMFLVQVKDDFDVGPGLESMPGLLKVLPECGAVVNLPVADQLNRVRLVRNGLMTPVDINDAESPLAQRDPIVMVKPLAVGPPVENGIGHPQNPHAPLGRIVIR
jgi:hypothetical protein